MASYNSLIRISVSDEYGLYVARMEINEVKKYITK